MRILLINWQDWTHPLAGGAEVHLREIFTRIAAEGHGVDLFCCTHAGAAAEETREGIRIMRRGGRATFNFTVMNALRRGLAGGYDVLVEDVNKIPFYSPLFVRMPLLVIVPHLFGTTVFREVAWPLAAWVYAWERPMRALYGGAARFEVISESTRADLVRRGIPSPSIDVVYCGIDRVRYTPGPDGRPETPPYLLYLGRLKRYKRVDRVIEAFRRVRTRVEGVGLVIAGEGDDRPRLERICRDGGLGRAVRFRGHVSGDEKVRLLRGATVAINPSEKEGWGLTNIEAQACGCPVVATDSPGLRESVVHGKTGFLVPDHDVGELAERVTQILGDPDLRRRLSRGAARWVARFDWGESASLTLGTLERVVAGDDG